MVSLSLSLRRKTKTTRRRMNTEIIQKHTFFVDELQVNFGVTNVLKDYAGVIFTFLSAVPTQRHVFKGIGQHFEKYIYSL